MRAVDDLFRRFAGHPYELGARLLRRLHSDQEQLRLAAIRWCDLIAAADPTPELSNSAQAYDLMMAASHGHHIFQELLVRARTERETYGGEPYFEYDSLLLAAMQFLWPHRELPVQYPPRLCEWAWPCLRSPMSAHTPLSLAERLHDFPEIAYSLLEYPPVARCADDVAGDPVLARAALALLRIRHGHPPSPADISALETPSASQYRANRELLAQLRGVLAEGKAIPEHIWPEIERTINGPRELEWYHALALLAACEQRQAQAIEHMAAHLREHPAPARALALMAYIPDVGWLLAGRGWRRKELGRKLLPLSRVLLARACWPTAAWLRCVEPLTRRAKGTVEQQPERSYELVKGILGEALLELALDDGRPASERERVIGALGLLAPRGDGASVIRALGKLNEHATLGAAVKRAQSMHRDRSREGVVDAETSLMDAMEHFLPAAAHLRGAPMPSERFLCRTAFFQDDDTLAGQTEPRA